MRTDVKTKIVCVCEGAVMIALAFVTELIFAWLNTALGISALLPFGGSVTASFLPIVYYSYRRGAAWGASAGIIYSLLQMMMGLTLPPAKTFASFALCILLDYVLAFAVNGIACVFARPFKSRLAGYGFGAVAVCALRFISSTLSGVILWGEYAPEGMNIWAYSIAYNGSYMLANAILSCVLILAVCAALDPKTLRPVSKTGK